MVMSLGELRCSQVGTRPGGAIQGHRGNMVILHNLVWEADNESKGRSRRDVGMVGNQIHKNHQY